MGALGYLLILFGAILELSNRSGAHATATASPPYYYGPRSSPSPSPLPFQQTIFDVQDFGAVGNGKTDDSKAFELAWEAACNSNPEDNVKITIPSGKTFLVSPIKFEGPCRCHTITFQILGSIIAPPKSEWKNKRSGEWLMFNGVENLHVVGDGRGLIDGQGDSWWRNEGNARPTAMRFSNCKNLEMSGLKHINSQKFHVSITDCDNANMTRLEIMAPPNSPNTDGIDIISSTNVRIHNCTIKTGDDCIAIKGGTSNITISQIICGPGHGISIGSLGENGKHEQVEGINVSNCTLNATESGVRIKTWQGGSGFAKNIVFSNITFTAVNNPVIIDQFYCPHKTCADKTSAVKVSNVKYVGLRGTSSSWKDATVSFQCSNTVPCTGILLDDVDIKSAVPHKHVFARCLNAHGTANDTWSPTVDCLIK